MAKEKVTACPCDSGNVYTACCGRYLDGNETAETAEKLMRSRYTAYALGNEAYLLDTWHPSTRPATLDRTEQPTPKWLGLKVLQHEQPDETHAIVAFVARYKINGRAFKLQETSQFVKEDGCWFYVDGDTEGSTA